jgi:hypothetical protein
VIVAAAWLAWGGRYPSASSGDVRATGEAARRPASGLAIADFGGVKDDYGYVRDFSDVERLGFLSADETTIFDNADAGPARVLVDGDLPAGRLIVVVTRVRDRDTAKTAAEALNELQISQGFVRRSPLMLDWLALGDPDIRPTARIHYRHNDLLVRMELVGRTDQDVTNGFAPLVNTQLDLLPADG